MKWNHPLLGANPFLMPMLWNLAIFNLVMTAPRKPKQTAEVISITAKADKLRINKN